MTDYVDFLANDYTDYRAVLVPAGTVPTSGDRSPHPSDRIMFFDLRYPQTEHGQFIAEYYTSTLAPSGSVTTGLKLPDPWSSVDALTLVNLLAEFYPHLYS